MKLSQLAAWLAVVLASCDSSTAATPPPASAPAPVLPGTLWYVDDHAHALARAGGGRVVLRDALLFPSHDALPDGRLVAIASRGDGSPTSEQLALVSRAGRVARIGPTGAMVRDPAVDPRGRWIVVAANLDGHSDLYRVDVATGTTTRLTHDDAGNFTPAIVGDAIAFASSRDGDSEIYALAGDTPRRLTAFHRDDFAPVAAAGRIVFASDREGPVRLFAMAPDGTDQHRLTSRDAGGDEHDPAVSRDGARLAYVVDRVVYVRDLATGAERAVTPPGAHDDEPCFSPDGRWLAVSRDDAIVAIELATGSAQRVAAGRLPRWLD